MGKKIRERILSYHKEGYDSVVLYGTTRNRQRTSLFYKKGKIRKTIDFIFPTQKTWVPMKIVTFYNAEELPHCEDGPARIITCLEHRMLIAEEFYYKGKEIPEEGIQLLKYMMILKSKKNHKNNDEKEDDVEHKNEVIEELTDDKIIASKDN